MPRTDTTAADVREELAAEHDRHAAGYRDCLARDHAPWIDATWRLLIIEHERAARRIRSHP